MPATVAVSVAAGPLEPALLALAGQTNVKLLFQTSITSGMKTKGISGAYTPPQAFALLLEGTGLTYRFSGPKTVTIYGASGFNANAQSVQLGTIFVEGNSPFGPVKGYVANRTYTATKTDTPIIEVQQSISVVTRDQIEAQQADSMKQALRYSAGVSSENRVNFGAYDIMYSRGFILDRYLDGMRLQGNTGFVTPQTDIYGVERIELLRGPASVLFGQGSPAGIVNMMSKLPTATPFAEVVFQGGSFGRIQGGFDFGGPADKDGKFLYRLTGFFRDADNQVDFVREQRVYIAPSFTWRPTNDTSLTLLFKYQNDPKAGYYNFVPYRGSLLPNPNGTIPTSFYAGDPSFNDISRTQWSAGYILDHRFNDVFSVRQNVRFLDTTGNLNQVLPLDMSADGTTLFRYAQATRERISALSTDTQGQAKFSLGPVDHKVLFGIDTQRTLFTQHLAQQFAPDLSIFNPVYNVGVGNPFDDPTALDFRAHQTQTQTGIYLQDQLKIGRLSILAGGRRDSVHSDTTDVLSGINTPQTDHAYTGRIGGVYLFDFGLAPFGTYATSFNPTAGVTFAGEPFRPTTGKMWEAGVKYQPKGFNSFVQLSYFDLRQQNALTADPVNIGFQVQTGEIQSRGWEFEAKASLTDRLDLILSYTSLDARVTQSNDVDLNKVPLYTPRHIAAAWADYTIREGRFKGLGFGAGVRYVGETFADTANTLTVPSYTIVDAALHYDLAGLDPTLKGMKLSVNANNLFDKTYLSQCTTIGSGPYTNCVYGLRRQVLATLRYSW